MNEEPPETTRRWRPIIHRRPWQAPGAVVLQRRWPTSGAAKQEAIAVLAECLLAPGWVSGDERSWLELCLDEALTNAMLHGNEGDPELAVEATVAIDERCWHVGISDQGRGFRARALPPEDDPASLLLEHGRGIRLMRSWLSALSYWRDGATVVLSRWRADRSRDG
ncbi:MAG: ATP-binding protein [Planctomycetes bacterium]|nr:ATP-binding protein [Planctomycetota bacterium]